MFSRRQMAVDPRGVAGHPPRHRATALAARRLALALRLALPLAADAHAPRPHHRGRPPRARRLVTRAALSCDVRAGSVTGRWRHRHTPPTSRRHLRQTHPSHKHHVTLATRAAASNSSSQLMCTRLDLTIEAAESVASLAVASPTHAANR